MRCALTCVPLAFNLGTSLSSKPVWSTWWIPDQPGVYSQILLRQTKQVHTH